MTYESKKDRLRRYLQESEDASWEELCSPPKSLEFSKEKEDIKAMLGRIELMLKTIQEELYKIKS